MAAIYACEAGNMYKVRPKGASFGKREAEGSISLAAPVKTSSEQFFMLFALGSVKLRYFQTQLFFSQIFAKEALLSAIFLSFRYDLFFGKEARFCSLSLHYCQI